MSKKIVKALQKVVGKETIYRKSERNKGETVYQGKHLKELTDKLLKDAIKKKKLPDLKYSIRVSDYAGGSSSCSMKPDGL